MSQPTFPRPAEPLVSKNPFRQQTYTRQNIPPFAEAKAQLPLPVLPGKPEWLEMYWRAWEMAWAHLRRPRTGSDLVANYLTPTADDHIFMWDAAFTVQFGVYGRRAYKFVTMLDNFYARQHEDGYICREVTTEGQDFFYPFDPNGTGPNILAWAEW